MRFFSPSFLLACVCVPASILGTYMIVSGSSTEHVTTHSAPTVERVSEMGELCVLKLELSDMLSAYTPSLAGSWIIYGDALISVDLSNAEITASDTEKKSLSVKLPALRVTSPRVDHNRTKAWDMRSNKWHDGWFTLDKFGKANRLQQEAMKAAQNNLAKVAGSPEYMTSARESAEQLISALYAETGYTVTFEWEGDSEGETASSEVPRS